MADSIIKVDGVSKDFKLPHEKIYSIKGAFVNIFKTKDRTVETQHALRGIDLTINEGDFFGIVGRNGSGKSTLLKLLAGIYKPTKGKIMVRGKLVPFIELGVGFNPELTGRENVYLNGAMLGFSKREIDQQYDDIVAFAELEEYMDKKLKNYSSGMQVRLAFSMAIRARADILLIDEVLAVGDADFQRKCFDYFQGLKRDKKTVVFVSHDMNAIKEFCTRAALIERSEVAYVGTPKDVARKYSMLFVDEAAEQANEQNPTEGKTRWGSKAAMYSKVKVSQQHDDIIIEATIKADKDINHMLYGVRIVAEDGAEVIAIDNRTIEAPDITDVAAGKAIKLQWKILNVLSDGDYSVTLTLTDDSELVFDWFTNAQGINVSRARRSYAAVLPPAKVIVQK